MYYSFLVYCSSRYPVRCPCLSERGVLVESGAGVVGIGSCGFTAGEFNRAERMEGSRLRLETADKLRGADVAAFGYRDHRRAVRGDVGERFRITFAVTRAVDEVYHVSCLLDLAGVSLQTLTSLKGLNLSCLQNSLINSI